jgi:hypothetical protein
MSRGIPGSARFPTWRLGKFQHVPPSFHFIEVADAFLFLCRGNANGIMKTDGTPNALGNLYLGKA